MNVYDPMDRIVYRHMDQRSATRSRLLTSPRSITQLPSGYANASPRTYLGRTARAA